MSTPFRGAAQLASPNIHKNNFMQGIATGRSKDRDNGRRGLLSKWKGRKGSRERGRRRLVASTQKCCSFPALAEVSPHPTPSASSRPKLSGCSITHRTSSLSGTAFRALRVNSVYFYFSSYSVRTLRMATLFQRRACKSLPEMPRPFDFSSLVVSPKLAPSGNHVADPQLALQNLSRC
jgi:hypothetical protein